MSESIQTKRAVEVLRIPSGEQIQLPAETPVIVTQALGGSFTLLIPSQPGLYRLNGADGDAIGQSVTEIQAPAAVNGQVSESTVWDTLKSCYDPEIPVDIVNLGLVYGCEIRPDANGSLVNVKMTLTAPGCGMGPVLANEAEVKLRALPGVADASVELVWDPPWSADRITSEGREKLGMM